MAKNFCGSCGIVRRRGTAVIDRYSPYALVLFWCHRKHIRKVHGHRLYSFWMVLSIAYESVLISSRFKWSPMRVCSFKLLW